MGGGGDETPRTAGTEQFTQNTQRVEGPYQKRHCHDVLFLLLFFATWGGMWYVTTQAIAQGDPRRLLLPMDFQGNLCGNNNLVGKNDWIEEQDRKDFTDSKYLYYLNPILGGDLSNNKCVEECPQISGNVPFTCSAPTTGSSVNSTCVCPYRLAPSEFECYAAYRSEPIARRCVPVNDLLNSDRIEAESKKFNNWLQKTFAEEARGWHWILLSGLVALVLSFVWIILLRIFAGFFVWITIIVCWLLIAGAGLWMFLEARRRKDVYAAQDPQDPDYKRNTDYILYGSYAVFGIAFILLCIIIFMIKRIQIAVGVIKHAGKAITSVPLIIFVPIIAFIWVGLVFLYFVYIGLYLYSAGDIKVEGFRRTFEFNDTLRNMIYFHIFGSVWTILFIIGAADTVMNTAVAFFYFNHPESPVPGQKRGMPTFPIFKSIWTIIRYHLGSVAFGTLCIAIVVCIRIFFAMWQKSLKKLKENSSVVKCVLCYVNYCLWYFQKFLEFITSHAFVQIAIFGESFCTSAKNGYKLIACNPMRVAAVAGVSAFVMFLGKIFVVACTVLVGIEMLKTEDPPIESVILYVIIGIGAYIIAVLFFNVYESAIRTVLHCFIEDEQANQPNVYAPESLQKYMNDQGRKGKSETQHQAAAL